MGEALRNPDEHAKAPRDPAHSLPAGLGVSLAATESGHGDDAGLANGPAGTSAPMTWPAVASVPDSLFAPFAASVLRHPDRPALALRDQTLSYRELDRQARAIAAAILSASNGEAGLRCALLGRKGASTFAGVLGILAAGCTYVPLNPRFPQARNATMLRHSGAAVLLLDEASHEAGRSLLKASDTGLTVLLPGLAALPDWCADMPRHHRFLLVPPDPGPEAERLPVPVGPDQPAYLLFTSGSTGAPKGIAITHANALAYVGAVMERYGPTEQDRFSQTFDLTFDLSVHDMFLCWSAGACLYPVPPTAGLGLGAFIQRNALTFWFSVPSTAALMARLRELSPGAFPSLRWSLFCGEALPTRLATLWQAAAPSSTVENLYGPTEATIAFTAYRLPADPPKDGVVPIGWPFPGQRVAILDQHLRRLPDGEVGELCLGGSQVAPGYWNRPDLTADRFRGPADDTTTRWYRTGDLAVMTSDHGLVFRGRADKQVKIRGYRVELQEVEDAMRAAGGIDLAAAIPWPMDEDGGARGIAGFVQAGADVAAILAGCRQRLADYMVPAVIREVADWPLNANGKTDYAHLKALLENACDAQ